MILGGFKWFLALTGAAIMIYSSIAILADHATFYNIPRYALAFTGGTILLVTGCIINDKDWKN